MTLYQSIRLYILQDLNIIATVMSSYVIQYYVALLRSWKEAHWLKKKMMMEPRQSLSTSKPPWSMSSSARLVDMGCYMILTASVHAKRLARMERQHNVIKEMWRGLILGTSFLGFGIDRTPWSRVILEKLIFG